MDLADLLGPERDAWRGLIQQPEGLRELVDFCHFSLTRKKLRVRHDQIPLLRSAYGRASKELPRTWDNRDRVGMLKAVAHFAINIGNAFDCGAETAFFVACILLGAAGYGFDLKLKGRLRTDFTTHVRSKRHTDLVELLDLHWY